MDQAFSQQAALICRHTFDTPEQVVEILDSCCRPSDPGEQQRKRHKTHTVEAFSQKLDEVAEWKDWAAVTGLWVKGLRHSASIFNFFSGDREIQTIGPHSFSSNKWVCGRSA